MKFEDLTPEQLEQAKKCESPEERVAFIEEYGIELSDEQLGGLAGGGAYDSCPGDDGNTKPGKRGHDWYETGETRPNKLLGDKYPDKLVRCRKCGETYWQRMLFA